MKQIFFFFLFCIAADTLPAQNIFPATGNAGIGTTQPAASLQVIGTTKLGSSKNYAFVDTDGSLNFMGSGGYKVGGNKYAFQYSGNPNYGLFFNAASLQYEFRNGAAASVFSINANKGDIRFGGNLYFDSSVYLRGYKFISISDTSNLFMGINAGAHNTASYNTTFGYNTLFSNITGYVNTAVGSYALNANVSGRANTATGAYALYTNSTSEANTATGAYALYNNYNGDGNTATGVDAMYTNVTGWHNTSTGVSSLYSNISGAFQSAHGFECLYYNTTGSFNTATAYHALYNNTSGSYNVAVGVRALQKNTTGSNNTAIGVDADAVSANLINATSVGSGAIVNASNKVVIGNSSVSVIGGQVGWSTLSDGRFKQNVQNNVPGLNFINRLQPVTYHFDAEKYERFVGKNDSTINADGASLQTAAKKVRSGFIAQDVETAAAAIHYDFDGVNKPQSDKDNYSLVYADLVPSLVKSVQELSKENDELKKEIDDIKAMLQNDVSKNQQSGNIASVPSLINKTSLLLEQNRPNPCNKTTAIVYRLPERTIAASLVIVNANAIVLQQQKLSSGNGLVTIDVSQFSKGVYTYFIIADGMMSEVKKIIVE